MESKKKPCPRCKRGNSIIHPTMGVLLCQNCQNQDEEDQQVKNPEFYNISKQERIQKQRDEFKGDLAMPWADGKPNPLFVRTYPDKLKDFYSDEEIANL